MTGLDPTLKGAPPRPPCGAKEQNMLLSGPILTDLVGDVEGAKGRE